MNKVLDELHARHGQAGSSVPIPQQQTLCALVAAPPASMSHEHGRPLLTHADPKKRHEAEELQADEQHSRKNLQRRAARRQQRGQQRQAARCEAVANASSPLQATFACEAPCQVPRATGSSSEQYHVRDVHVWVRVCMYVHARIVGTDARWRWLAQR